MASTCHSNTTFDTVLSVYHCTTTNNLSCDGATNDDACGGNRSSVTWMSIQNEENLIYIQGSDNSAGDFVLTMSEAIYNDLCESGHCLITGIVRLVGA